MQFPLPSDAEAPGHPPHFGWRPASTHCRVGGQAAGPLLAGPRHKGLAPRLPVSGGQEGGGQGDGGQGGKQEEQGSKVPARCCRHGCDQGVDQQGLPGCYKLAGLIGGSGTGTTQGQAEAPPL